MVVESGLGSLFWDGDMAGNPWTHGEAGARIGDSVVCGQRPDERIDDRDAQFKFER